MSLALPDDGKLIALDKNKETNKIALNFFNKANQEKKIQTMIIGIVQWKRKLTRIQILI